ncbi:MAG: nicotinamide-nucleotide amidase [Gammaproteobacteria bacterium]|nr:nicotinamide-nucleotide amidase [Gammaproteobacteria bacterium]MDH5694160.1 nicotinamide-nucleotide amidase [Gammaproteobacteria bacterium]
MDLLHSIGELGRRLLARRQSLATAESCTGGWIAKACTDVPGSSSWFDRGFVTYSNEAKQEMLGVREQTLNEFGAVSSETVSEMALGTIERSKADMAVSVSGIAGPGGGSVSKPVGTVFMAIAQRDGSLKVFECHFEGDRDSVRLQTVEKAITELLLCLKD